MNWCFAKINGRLAELFFDRKENEKEPKILGHCYVSPSKYRTKREQHMIEKDIERYQFSYRNEKYRDKITTKVLKNSPLPRRRAE